jgi:hypothetical protein
MSAKSLRGLTPEQVVAISGADTQREALRAGSIQNIFQAANFESELESRALRNEISREELDKVRKLAHLNLPAAQAALENTLAQTAESRMRTGRSGVLLPGELAGQDVTRRHGEQSIVASESAVRSQEEQLRQSREFFPLKYQKEVIDSTPYDLDMGGGKKITLTGKDMSQVLLESGRIADTQANREQVRLVERERFKIAEQKSEQERLSTATRAESNLIKPPSKQSTESMAPYVDEFNSNSKKPYVYIHFPDINSILPGFLKNKQAPSEYNNVNKQVPIPLIQGKQLTAVEIYKLAIAANKTVKQFLEEDVYRERGEKAPWQLQP